MAFNTSQLMVLIIFLQLRAGNTNNNTNDGNSFCRPVEIQEFQNKYCENIVNNTIIANAEDFSTAFQICIDLAKEFKQMVQYKELLNCQEIKGCYSNKRSTVKVCANVIRSILPPQFNNSNRTQALADIQATTHKIHSGFYAALGILFICGITTNGILFTIFIRHKCTRNDVMLINLTLADILSLIINLPFYIAFLTNQFGDVSTVFNFCSRLVIFISEYSLVIISCERFRAVYKKSEIRKEKKFPNWIKLTILWLVGTLYGSLEIIYAVVEGLQTKSTTIKMTYLVIVIEGIVPVALIMVPSVLASIRLKKLAENFPGERNHHVQRIQDRYLAAKALIGLAILFLISYLPYNIYLLIRINYYYNRKSFFTNILLDYNKWTLTLTITEIFRFLNSSLNPVVLYFLSSKFRKYFKSYICCKFRDLES